jgi:hypothetical protein
VESVQRYQDSLFKNEILLNFSKIESQESEMLNKFLIDLMKEFNINYSKIVLPQK